MFADSKDILVNVGDYNVPISYLSHVLSDTACRRKADSRATESPRRPPSLSNSD